MLANSFCPTRVSLVVAFAFYFMTSWCILDFPIWCPLSYSLYPSRLIFLFAFPILWPSIFLFLYSGSSISFWLCFLKYYFLDFQYVPVKCKHKPSNMNPANQPTKKKDVTIALLPAVPAVPAPRRPIRHHWRSSASRPATLSCCCKVMGTWWTWSEPWKKYQKVSKKFSVQGTQKLEKHGKISLENGWFEHDMSLKKFSVRSLFFRVLDEYWPARQVAH